MTIAWKIQPQNIRAIGLHLHQYVQYCTIPQPQISQHSASPYLKAQHAVGPLKDHSY